MNTRTALVRYMEDQVDDEGQPVSTNPFYIDFETDENDNVIEAILETGRVQFDWILEGVSP